MNMLRQMKGVLSLTLILVLLASAASAAPVIPQQYYGHVTINGVPATDGTLVVALIGGTDRGSITTVGGMYGGSGAFDTKLLVSADDSEVGQIISFTVNGNPVPQTSTVVAGGGSVQQLDLASTLDNPVPAIAALYPPDTDAGSGQFTLSVLGLNFVPGCTVQWNGEDRTTVYTSANQVSAIILASDVATQGTASVRVVNPSPGGGPSNTVTFLITEPQNPVPHIDNLDPSTCVEGASGFEMTVYGSNFIDGSTVYWNDEPRRTNFVSATELSVAIETADVAAVGDNVVHVNNPAPGGGDSNSVIFTVSSYISPLSIVPAGGDVFIGEQHLDVRNAVPNPFTQIVWYAPGHEPGRDAPDGAPYTFADKRDFYVDQATFLTKLGNWYLWDGHDPGAVAFVVKEPQISLKIYDPNGPVKDPNAEGIPIRFIGTDIDFLVESNLYTLAIQRNPGLADGFIHINIGSPNSVNYTALMTVVGADRNLHKLIVPNSYFRWSADSPAFSTPVRNNFWETAAKKQDKTLLYSGGIYTVWANCTANRMNINYNVIGKTTSESDKVNIVAEGVTVTANPSVMTRSNQSFTATVTGRPNTEYYLWVLECPLKRTGECCDQPPMIKDTHQEGVEFDPPGSTVIGSRVVTPACCNPGTRIIDTVPKKPVSDERWPSDKWHRYYAKITTDNEGKRNVDFEVNDCTKPSTYTLHAEGTDVNGKTIWAETKVTINLGVVTMTLNRTAYLGERIKISGTNTDTSKTYLFLRGPCLQLCGVNLRNKQPVVNNVPSSFVVANVTNLDITWALDQDPLVNPAEAVWDTSKLGIDAGEYTVYASSKPNDYCTLTGSCPGCVCAAWTSQNITLLEPGLQANITPEWVKTICTSGASYCNPTTTVCGDPCSPTILLSGSATGLIIRDADPGVTLNSRYNRDAYTKQLGFWMFGRTNKIGGVHYVHDYVNVSCDGTFSVDVAKIIAKSTPLQQIEPGTYDVLLVHPMYNHEFDVVHQDEAVDPTPPDEPNVKYVISTCPTAWSKEFVIEGPGAKWESEGRDAMILALNRTCVDDKYIWLSFTVRDHNAPVADFKAEPTEGVVPLEVLFTDYSLGDPMTFHWDFGDGTTYDTQFPNRNPPPHIYDKVGNYSPSLTVTNAKGISNTITKKDLIKVYPYPPEPLTADFSGTPRSGPAPLPVQFSDLSTDGPVLWLWNFGDGATSNLQHPSHTYSSPGNFTVSLVVWNATGSVAAEVKNDYITVTGQPITTTTTPVPYDKIGLKSNWNFVSVPKVLAEGNNTGSIFSAVDRAGHSIWYYDGFQKLWVRIDANTIIRPLEGIWIFSRTPMDVPLKFDTNPIMLPPTKKLAQGWNTVGFTGFTPATARDTLLSVKSNWTQTIGFDATAQAYEASIINGGSGEHSDQRIMYPTKGYWVYMNGAGEITAIGV